MTTKTGTLFTGSQGRWWSGGAAFVVQPHREEKLESFRPLKTSLMAEGLTARFTVVELRDLRAFLERLT